MQWRRRRRKKKKRNWIHSKQARIQNWTALNWRVSPFYFILCRFFHFLSFRFAFWFEPAFYFFFLFAIISALPRVRAHFYFCQPDFPSPPSVRLQQSVRGLFSVQCGATLNHKNHPLLNNCHYYHWWTRRVLPVPRFFLSLQPKNAGVTRGNFLFRARVFKKANVSVLEKLGSPDLHTICVCVQSMPAAFTTLHWLNAAPPLSASVVIW